MSSMHLEKKMLSRKDFEDHMTARRAWLSSAEARLCLCYHTHACYFAVRLIYYNRCELSYDSNSCLVCEMLIHRHEAVKNFETTRYERVL